MIDIQEMRGLVYDVVLYEANYGDYVDSDAAEGLKWDIDATVDEVTEYLLEDGTFYRVQAKPRWEAEEYVHLSALDWFSSYEPVLVRVEAARV